MSRVGVRQAVAAYLNSQQIPGVGTVYATRNYVNEQDYEQRILNGQVVTGTSTANGTGCVLMVNLTDDTRTRRADTGRGANNDSVIHKVLVEAWCSNPGGDPVACQEDYDAIVDAIFSAVRANPTMSGASWSAGEYGGVEHQQSSPYTGGGMTVLIVGMFRFDAWEWKAGNVPV